MANKKYSINRYTVWEASTDEVLIVCGTIDECCRVLGCSRQSFYNLRHAYITGKPVKYITKLEVCSW